MWESKLVFSFKGLKCKKMLWVSICFSKDYVLDYEESRNAWTSDGTRKQAALTWQVMQEQFIWCCMMVTASQERITAAHVTLPASQTPFKVKATTTESLSSKIRLCNSLKIITLSSPRNLDIHQTLKLRFSESVILPGICG